MRVVVVTAAWIEAFDDQEETGGDSYADYMGALRPIAQDSAKIGQDLAELLTTPGLKQDELETQLGGLIEQQKLDVTRAQDLDPPGPLTPERQAYLRYVNAEHESIVDAISRQDPEAARAAMRTHLGNSRERRRRLAEGR